MVSKSFSLALLLAIANVVLAQNAVPFTSSNLPIVLIDTQGQTIVDEPKIPAHMGIINNGPGNRNNVNDPVNDYNGNIGIEIRGSSSQSFPKKQYGVELRDGLGVSWDKSLLGLPKKDDWILFAAYDDKTLMRDVLAYHIGRQLGRYASRFKFVELVLNGTYQGVYVLLEKVKRDKNRVNIAKLDETMTTGDQLTGGYIIKIDKTTGGTGDGWASSHKPLQGAGWQSIYFQYEYPKAENITPEQKLYIAQYVSAFEDALNGDQYQDPVNGYRKYADMASFVDYFIVNELSKNPDGYRLSTFLHKQRDSDGGKIFMGPVWDYNEGFGNVDYCTGGVPSGWVLDFNSTCPNDNWQIPFWWKKLLLDSAFTKQLNNRWHTLRNGVLATNQVHAFIDSVNTVLNAEAQQRNFTAWPILGVYTWPNYYVGPDYASEINYLKGWVTSRLNWMDAYLPQVVTGIEKKNELPVRLYPNPLKAELYLDYDALPGVSVELRLFDVMGRQMISAEFRGAEGFQTAVVSTAELSPGVYIVEVRQGNAATFRRVVKAIP